MKCEKCGVTISEDEKLCQSCAIAIANELTLQHKSVKTEETAKDRLLTNFIKVTILCFIGFLIFKACSSIVKDPDWTEYDESFAITAAQQEVLDALKSPSTADFPSLFDEYNVSWNEDGNIYTIKGYVDAQNSFGTMVRATFLVKIERTGIEKYISMEVSIYE